MEIEVDPAVFAHDGDSSNEKVIIVGSSDPSAAKLALFRAGQRFYAVAEDGRELSGEEADAAAGDLYTPNWVSDVRLAPRGPWVYVDCKGYIWPAMRERMIKILVEELERAGVSARVEVPSDDEL
ncbi:hypothetical protein GCM10029978_037290 [Actinoallomurus acanthiterrae]